MLGCNKAWVLDRELHGDASVAVDVVKAVNVLADVEAYVEAKRDDNRHEMKSVNGSENKYVVSMCL